MKSTNRASKKLSGAFLGAIFGLLSLGVARSQTYDVVDDFSLASNPNGTWSYGDLSSVTSGTLSVYTVTDLNADYTGQEAWTTGGSVPVYARVEANVSGSTQTAFNTVLHPTDQVNLDGESFIADVRWTAPVTGIYDVSGLFQRNDNSDNSEVDVVIAENSTSTLFSADDFITYLSQESFNFVDLDLTAGTTLDFAEAPVTGPYFDAVGLEATITTVAVPEPSTYALLGLGVLALLIAARRKIA